MSDQTGCERRKQYPELPQTADCQKCSVSNKKITKYANRKKKPMGNRNFQFSVTVISVRFKAVKEALMNRFKELKETILEELKEGTKAVFHQIEYQ